MAPGSRSAARARVPRRRGPPRSQDKPALSISCTQGCWFCSYFHCWSSDSISFPWSSSDRWCFGQLWCETGHLVDFAGPGNLGTASSSSFWPRWDCCRPQISSNRPAGPWLRNRRRSGHPCPRLRCAESPGYYSTRQNLFVRSKAFDQLFGKFIF